MRRLVTIVAADVQKRGLAAEWPGCDWQCLTPGG